MPTIMLRGKAYEVDQDGLLQELDKWSQEFAQEYAKEEGIEGPLTEEHWKVIKYLRNHYSKFGNALMIRKLCKETGFSPTGPKCSDLLATGYRGITSNPRECVSSSGG